MGDVRKLLYCQSCKGWTIRKVMGGGGGVGNFWLARIFFLAYCLCKNFFFDCSAVHEFFFFDKIYFMHNLLLNLLKTVLL